MSIYVEVYKDDEKIYKSIVDVPSDEKVTEYDELAEKFGSMMINSWTYFFEDYKSFFEFQIKTKERNRNENNPTILYGVVDYDSFFSSERKYRNTTML